MTRPLHLLIAVAFTMATMVMSGCQSSYGHVVEPPLTSYSPAMFGEASPDEAHIPSAFTSPELCTVWAAAGVGERHSDPLAGGRFAIFDHSWQC